MRLAHFIVPSLLLALSACGDSNSGEGGPGGGGAPLEEGGSGGAGGGLGGGAVGPADPSLCPLQGTDEEACLSLGCIYKKAVLFAELVCSEGVEIHTCTWYGSNGGFQSPLAWSRETPDGLMTIKTGEQPFDGPVGFLPCNNVDGGESGEVEYCDCLE